MTLSTGKRASRKRYDPPSPSPPSPSQPTERRGTQSEQHVPPSQSASSKSRTTDHISGEADCSEDDYDSDCCSQGVPGTPGDEPSPVQVLPPIRPVKLLIPHSLVLWGIFLSTGKRALTEEQYTIVRSLISCALSSTSTHWRAPDMTANLIAPERNRSAMPCYTTITRRFRDDVLRFLAAPLVTVPVPVSLRANGARIVGPQNANYPTTQIAMILPSVYAKMDIGCTPIWESFQSNDVLDDIPIIRQRLRFYSPRHSVIFDSPPDFTGLHPTANIGDEISFQLYRKIAFDYSCLQYFTQGTGAEDIQAANPIFQGVIASIFLVRHVKRRPTEPSPAMDDDFDGFLENYFGFISFDESLTVRPPQRVRQSTAPGSSGAGPSSSGRRPSKRARRAQKDPSPGAGPHPLKPGDIVVSIRPTVPTLDAPNNAASKPSRFFIVHRFWAEEGEDSRHILLLNDKAPFASTPDEFQWKDHFLPLKEHRHNYLTAKVKSFQFISARHRTPGSLPQRTASTSGYLSNGKPYFIYRYLLFTDGFNMKYPSGITYEGVYIVPLNFPPQTRKSSSTARIITAAPAGVSPSAVIRALYDDIVTGSTSGFPCTTADGADIQLFLDMVGVFGDTLALNKAIDSASHRSVAPCHLCRSQGKIITTVGCKFAHEVSTDVFTASRRFFHRHQAVRDSNPKEASLQYLGFKKEITGDHFAVQGLHERLSQDNLDYPCDSAGVPLLPQKIDPFVGSLITPDHLISGLARNAINFAIFCLYPLEHRVTFQLILNKILDANSVTMSRALYDPKDGVLKALPMRHVFLLLIYVPLAYAICIRKCFVDEIPGPVLHAAEVLRTFQPVAALLSRPPHESVDLLLLQDTVRKYFAAIRKTCEFQTNTIREVGETRPAGKKKSAKSAHKSRRELTALAIRALDVPNVHRLYEYVFFVLPSITYPSFTRELPMEKLHSNVKLLIQRACSDTPHLYAMRNTTIDDWKSRLTLIRVPVSSTQIGTLKYAVNLLGGELQSRKVTPNYPFANLAVDVNTALTGAGYTPLSYCSHAVSIFPRKASHRDLWTTNEHHSTFYHFSQSDIRGLPSRLRKLLKTIARQRQPGANGVFSCDSISRIPFYGKDSHPICVGKFITVQCYNPYVLPFHRPYLRLVSSGALSGVSNPVSPMVCRISGLFMPVRTCHEKEVIMIVTPYLPAEENALQFQSQAFSFLHFKNYHAPSPVMSILRPDNSVRPAASFLLSAEYLPGAQSKQFIIDSSTGFPGRSG